MIADPARVRGRRLLALVLVALGAAVLSLVSPWTEAVGAATGAVCVWLAAVSDPWTWPIGIANNLFYLVIFWGSGLYADALLQVFYAAISAYGIYRWTSGRGAAPVRPVERGGRVELLATGAAIAASAATLWILLARFTDSTVPAWDGVTTAMSLGAQWLMSRRVIENWWIWIAVDLLYVPLYVYKGLWVTAGLYAVFLGLCVLGLVDWRRELARQPLLRPA